MSIRINDEAPDFSAETTQGAIHSGELEAWRRCDHLAGRIGRGSETEISRWLEDIEALPAVRFSAGLTVTPLALWSQPVW